MIQEGYASWYGYELAGRKTASGKLFNPDAFTTAHRTLKFGTPVRVTCFETGKSVTVRINDRGPWVEGRIIDLSRAAFSQIANLSQGVIYVKVEICE
ncbi:MAG: septal ring lytic transglycosylase RlpA family protein [Actinomycetota bacterium]